MSEPIVITWGDYITDGTDPMRLPTMMASAVQLIGTQIVPPRTSTRPAAGFNRCEDCAGMGFLRSGAFGLDRTFLRCTRCDATGQLYLPHDDTP